MPDQRHCAVLGSPIEHSLSPVLHRAAYAELGLDWVYDAHEIDEALLPGFLSGLGREWRGLSLTMPLKRAAIPLCDSVSELASAVGAVNTVLFQDGFRRGENTDVPGMVAAFRERGVTSVRNAAILGAGATACSAAAALAKLGAQHVVAYARNLRRTGTLDEVADRFGISLDPKVALGRLERVGLIRSGGLQRGERFDVVVSTIPAEAVAPIADQLVEDADVLFEVLYDPWPTPLVEAGWAKNRLVVGGLDLLVHQAALQVELMTGQAPAPVDAMRRAGEQALASCQ